jgi:hypothetical protein
MCNKIIGKVALLVVKRILVRLCVLAVDPLGIAADILGKTLSQAADAMFSQA